MILYILISALTLIYLALLIICVAGISKKKAIAASEVVDGITVLIPVKNEEKNIAAILQILVQQQYRNFEIIVINDHSTDNTLAIASEFAIRFPETKIRVMENETGKGKKQAIITGVKYGSMEIIAVTDADCDLPVHWLSHLSTPFSDQRIKMVCGPVLNREPVSFWEHIRQLDQLALTGTSLGFMNTGMPLMCSAANMAFRKAAFYGCGNYSDNKNTESGDDVFLLHNMVRKYGSSAVHFVSGQEALVTTAPPEGFCEFFRQRLRWGAKARYYRAFFPAFMTLITVLAYTGLLAGLLLLPVYPAHFALLSISLGAKAAIDFLLLFLTGRVVKNSESLKYFLPAFVFHLFYVPVVSLFALFPGKKKWK